MNLPDHLLPATWMWVAHILYALIAVVAWRRAPWKRLANSAMLNVFLGATVAVLVLWQLRAGVLPGLNFHILGTSLLTLMFGWPLAVVCVSANVAAITFYDMGGWPAYSANVLLMGVLPAAVTHGVLRLTNRNLPRNLFVYIFVCGFFGAALAMAATGIVSAALFVWSNTYPLDDLMQYYLPYYLLMMFPEAIITGTWVALLAVYRPEWIWSYDEDLYLSQ